GDSVAPGRSDGRRNPPPARQAPRLGRYHDLSGDPAIARGTSSPFGRGRRDAMIRDPRFRTPDDELAVRLSRYWDDLVEEDTAPSEPASDLGDLVGIVRGLAESPRDSAPEDFH